MKYRKKAIQIEAEQFTFENKDRAFNFIRCNCSAETNQNGDPEIKIQTLEGIVTASLGDYIIKGVKGEFYPCKSDIFHLTYDKI